MKFTAQLKRMICWVEEKCKININRTRYKWRQKMPEQTYRIRVKFGEKEQEFEVEGDKEFVKEIYEEFKKGEKERASRSGSPWGIC